MSADCRITESILPSGYRAVSLHNDLVAVTLLPEKGAGIYSLVYKPRTLDILWKSPWGLPRRGAAVVLPGGNTEAAWMDQYEGGWQELFPNGGDECVYKNAPLNFHGEASLTEWNCSLLRQENDYVEIELSVQLRRSPFSVTRNMSLQHGVAGFRIHERIVNLGDEDLAFMWGHHPAFGGPFLAGGLQLHTSNRSLPIPADPIRIADFGYLRDLDEGWYALSSNAHGFGFGLAWPRDVFPYLWLWQERRGTAGYPWYGRCSVMAVEPFTSIPATGLLAAIEAGTAPVLPAHAGLEVDLAAVFFDLHQGAVQTIRTDGTILFR